MMRVSFPFSYFAFGGFGFLEKEADDMGIYRGFGTYEESSGLL